MSTQLSVAAAFIGEHRPAPEVARKELRHMIHAVRKISDELRNAVAENYAESLVAEHDVSSVLAAPSSWLDGLAHFLNREKFGVGVRVTAQQLFDLAKEYHRRGDHDGDVGALDGPDGLAALDIASASDARGRCSPSPGCRSGSASPAPGSQAAAPFGG